MAEEEVDSNSCDINLNEDRERVRCNTLDSMLKKTILALCEVNVKYDVKLEVCGSIHIRSDDEKVLTCLLDEKLWSQDRKLRREGMLNTIRFGLKGLEHRPVTSAAVMPIKINEAKINEAKINEVAQAEERGEEGEAVDLSNGLKKPEDDQDQNNDPKDIVMKEEKDDVRDDPRMGCDLSGGKPSPLPGDTMNHHGALDLSSNNSDCEGYTDSEGASPRDQMPPHEMAPMLGHGMNGMPPGAMGMGAMGAWGGGLGGVPMGHVMNGTTAPSDLVAQQIAALNQMAEFMQSSLGMVMPPTQTAMTTAYSNAPTTLTTSVHNGGGGPHQSPLHHALPHTPLKSEPMTSSTSTSPTSIVAPPYPTAVAPPTRPPMSSGGMMMSPIQSAMMAGVTMESIMRDPLTIGNPVQTKTGVKKWQCIFCGILVSSKFYLSSHINAVHTRTRIYPCEMCGKLFYSHGAQRIHKLRNHWVEKRHKCPHCGQLFVLPFELRQHVQRKHKPAISS